MEIRTGRTYGRMKDKQSLFVAPEKRDRRKTKLNICSLIVPPFLGFEIAAEFQCQYVVWEVRSSESVFILCILALLVVMNFLHRLYGS